MTALDILFWLLVALLGAITWSIEAGLGQRYRNLLACSVLSASFSALVIMFWVDDKTAYKPLDAQEFAKTKKKRGEGSLENNTEEEGGGGGSGGGKDGAPNGGAANAANGKMPDGKKKEGDEKDKDEDQHDESKAFEDDGKIVYGREPFKDCPLCPDMVIVPSGVAQVGSPVNEAGRSADEPVAATIPVDQSFAIGRLEITRAEFDAFVKETRHESRGPCDVGKRRGVFNWQKPGFEQDERHPVVCVTWQDVRQYIGWLGEKTGRTYRLPNEIEWEHAARAGKQTPFWSGQSVARSEANINRSRDGTTVGGSFTITPFGLSDVIGNAGELIGHCAPQPEQTPAGSEPPPCKRFVKGGAWSTPTSGGRHAARLLLIDGASANWIGFRVARDVDDRDEAKRLNPQQRRVLAKAEKDAAEIKAREVEEAEAAKRKAREPPPAEAEKKK